MCFSLFDQIGFKTVLQVTSHQDCAQNVCICQPPPPFSVIEELHIFYGAKSKGFIVILHLACKSLFWGWYRGKQTRTFGDVYMHSVGVPSETLLPETREALWSGHSYSERAGPRAPSPPPEGSDTPHLTGSDYWLPGKRLVFHTACGLALEGQVSDCGHKHNRISSALLPYLIYFSLGSWKSQLLFAHFSIGVIKCKSLWRTVNTAPGCIAKPLHGNSLSELWCLKSLLAFPGDDYLCSWQHGAVS